MIRKSHLLLALALVAAAVAAPIAQSSSTPKVDPLAVSYLIGQGFTPSQIQAWTTGACSHQTKPATCFDSSRGANLAGPSKGTRLTIPPSLARLHEPGSTGYVPMPTQAKPPVQRRGAGDFPIRPAAPPRVDPLAVSYLTGQGLSPSQVTSWTTGTCSHQVKAPSCYAMFRPAATSSAATSPAKEVTGSTSFQWGDAGIGAGFTLGIILLLGAVGAGVLISRQNRRHQTARA
jgi:hypothetical protein